MAIGAYFRLARAGYVLAREGAFSIVDPKMVPPSARAGVALARLIERRSARGRPRAERLATALQRLGPTYVKFAQTLSTRPDIVGIEIARDLSVLQDRMPPFDAALVPGLLAEALGPRAATLIDIGPPVAAASVAQVHRAVVVDASGTRRPVAVKVLRPAIRERFLADLDSYFAAARWMERLVPAMRRLRPVDVVDTLRRSALVELDLRLEGAAISEMTGNIAKDEGFTLPSVDWDHTAETVLTTTWIDGIPIADIAALDAAGLDRRDLARKVLQSFLRHAIRDGYFHADMHPGNLFVEPATARIVAVDFGIMGRLTRPERRFLADIVYGFITRDYRQIALRHFELGYVPSDKSLEDFALALRAIGEPLHGRKANDISMARVLGQLFTTTELFDMQTRPELVLLQKSMVLVEGVARNLDPDLDIWSIAEPVVGDWVRREAGPLGRLEDLSSRLREAGEMFSRLPAMVERGERLLADEEARRIDADTLPVPGWLLTLATILLVGVLLVSLLQMLF